MREELASRRHLEQGFHVWPLGYSMNDVPLVGEDHLSRANQRLSGLIALWMVVGMILGILGLTINKWILVGVFALMIAVSVLSYQVRCHSCGWPLIKRWWGYAPFAPRNCPKCGEKVA